MQSIIHVFYPSLCNKQILRKELVGNHGFSRRAHTNKVDWHSNSLFDVLHILLSIHRQFLKRPHSTRHSLLPLLPRDVLFPSRQFIVHHLHLLQLRVLGRHSTHLLPIQQILTTHLDGVQTCQNVQLGQTDTVKRVQQIRVRQRRGRPVVAPNSCPSCRNRSPISFSCSVGNGPSPTRVV